MPRRFAWLGLALVVGALPARLSAQDQRAYLRLRVVDAVTLTPIYGAAVNLPELRLYTLSDEDGMARLAGIPSGDHAIEVTMLGYGVGSARIHLDPGAVGLGEIRLETRPIELAGIVVNGRTTWDEYLDRSGYYERAKLGLGYHWERADIRRSFAEKPSEILRRVPISNTETGGCPWTIWLDGVRTRMALDDQLIGWIEAIEIFPRRVDVPIEFTRPETCRAILIWTGTQPR